MISIITPSYKTEAFISQTIDSVLNQTYQNWELIIIDDASPDNSNSIIQAYAEKDARIKLRKLHVHHGAAVARNLGIKEARGRYIAFLDSDDLWRADKLEKQLRFMQTLDCAFSYTNYEKIDEKGRLLGNTVNPPHKLSYQMLLYTCKIGCLTTMYDTHKIGKIYMPIIEKRQDYCLWLEILKEVDYAYGINQTLARYRVREQSLSSKKIGLLTYHYLVFRKHQNFSIFKSLYHVLLNVFFKLSKDYV